MIAFADKFHELHESAQTLVEEWIENGDEIATSAIAWSEFRRGADANHRSILEVVAVEFILNAGILPFDQEQATKAAELFNFSKREENRPNDCMIAACALCANAELATNNITHFQRFEELGLKLRKFN